LLTRRPAVVLRFLLPEIKVDELRKEQETHDKKHDCKTEQEEARKQEARSKQQEAKSTL